MIAFEFILNGARCITDWIDWENHSKEENVPIGIYVNDTYYPEGILKISVRYEYIYIVAFGFNCDVVAVKMNGYDRAFVEAFHPDYNGDKIANLDDMYCAEDNEVDNNSHWNYLANEVVEEDWERAICEAIFNDTFDTDFISEAAIGAYLANKYKETIANDINYAEGDIMEEAIDEFEYEFHIEEE